MKSRLFLLLCLLLVSAPQFFWAKPVPYERASEIAYRYLQNRADANRTGQGQLQLHTTQANTQVNRDRENLFSVDIPAFSEADSESVPFHIIADVNGGFVIVAGDDRVTPILASSLENTISAELSQLPPSFLAWMRYYQRQIEYVVENDLPQDASIEAQWARVSAGGAASSLLETHAVYSLLGTNWNQSPYYNDLCPYDSNQNATTLTGCVATAMAQIMKYWGYPNNGRGSSRYHHSDYGVLTADYGSTQYQWAQMPNQLSSSSSNTQVNAVATLMYHCGVSVQMDYGVDGSGISDITKVVDSLKGYFNYGSTASLVKREATTDSIWLSSLKNELNSNRPVFYVGFDPNGEGGHAWVCDGYNDDNHFHMNWGWSGYADGYFALSSLIPSSDFNFTDYQMAVIGIAPQESTNQSEVLKLYRSISVDPNPADQGSAITVQSDVINTSSSSFSGTIAAGVFTSANQLVMTVSSFSESDLPAGYHYSEPLTFTRANTASLQPGTYYISVIYQATGSSEWIKASDEDYSNWTAFTINGGASDLTLYAPLTIGDGGVILQNTTFNIGFNVYNSGTSSFSGAVEVDFYNLDGSYRFDVGTLYHYDINGLDANYYYTSNRTTTIYGGVDLPPGEYLAAVTHLPANANSWELTGAGDYANPITIFVQEGADSYEPNDTAESATYLVPTYSNNLATITTSGATIHTDEDIDLYWMSFPAGLDYQIEARVHDSWDSDNGNTYTTDVFWILGTSKSDDIEFYDDIMDAPIRLNNGGEIAIGVGGWGYNLGTYQLEINIQRMALGALDPNDPHNYLTPLYRFYRAGNDSHFFTANEAEKNSIISTQPADFWVYEGISQRVLHSQIPNAVPVYRMFNKISKSHFYSALPSEIATIQQNLGHIFTLEGIAFYALDTPVYGAKPVYRFFSTATASHFFTISKFERDQIIATIPESKLRYEGVAWYAYP